MGKKHRICPICGREFTEITKHYNTYHINEMSLDLFLAKMNGLEEIPKCPVCGKDLEYDWSKQHFFKSCRNPRCQSGMRSINRKKEWNSPGEKERRSEIQKNSWTISRRIEASDKLTEIYKSPEIRNKVSLGVRKAYEEKPEFREKIRRTSKEHWQNPEYALKVKLGINKSFEDKDQYLYLIGFKDNNSGNFVVKCGTSVDYKRRLEEYKYMNYEFIKGYYTEGKFFEMLDLEYRVHGNGFSKYYMDLRTLSKMSNGPTEWYQANQLYPIKNFIESQIGEPMREIQI